MWKMNITEVINSAIREAFPGINITPVKLADIRRPPKREMGDFSFACFEIAREVCQEPAEIASLLEDRLLLLPFVSKTETKGPYINFFLKRGEVIKQVCERILKEGSRYGCNKSRQGQKIMVEFSSPNTNKPLHLGHLRNTLLGDALASILEANGAKVVRANLINDRGIHICKTMLAYQKWGNDATPKSLGIKGDHYVGDLYVQFEKAFKQEISQMEFGRKDFESWARERGLDLTKLSEKEIEVRRNDYYRNRSLLYREAQSLLKKWEEGDEEVRRLWKTMNEWVIDGFKETYNRLGVSFDRYYLESETYTLGKSLVENGLSRGIFKKDSTGAVIVNLHPYGLGKKILLRPDGTSLYITQDLGTAVIKQRDYNLTHSICVVAREQEYHFKVLAKLLNLLGYKWASGLYHMSYGLVLLPEGRMKSREGTVVDVDDFLDDLFGMALKEVSVRGNVPPDLQASLARVISLAAAKFGFLSVQPIQDMVFDPKKEISFEGRTGPYIQYANVRAKSILKKASNENVDPSSAMALSSDAEMELALMLADYPAVVEEAGQEYNPSLITNYLYRLAQAFSVFYHTENVLKEENEKKRRGRLALCASVSQVLVNGLALLGIEAPEIM